MIRTPRNHSTTPAASATSTRTPTLPKSVNARAALTNTPER
jgi:hypothetical protein